MSLQNASFIKPVTELWYNNPTVLLNNLDQFFPMDKLTHIEKINSLARFAIYYSILIWILNKDSKWYYIPVGILLISYLMGTNNYNQPSELLTNKKINGFTSIREQPQNPINSNLFIPSETFDNNQPHKLIRNVIKSQLNDNDNWAQYDTNKTYYSIDTFGDVNRNDWRENQSNFMSWCYGNNSSKPLNNQPQYITTNDDTPKDINIYYDANNLKKLVNNCLTFKIHLVDKNNVIL
jgi:hypothetical protein